MKNRYPRLLPLLAVLVVLFTTLHSSQTSAQSNVKIQLLKDTVVYAGPGINFPVIGNLDQGGRIILSGISDDRQWYFFMLWDIPAWIPSDPELCLLISGDPEQLKIIQRTNYTPQPTNTPRPTLPPTPIPPPSSTPRPQPATITVSLSGTPMIRISFLEAWFDAGSGFMTPKNGFTYLVARIRVENLNYQDPFTGTASLDVSPFDFKILDANGTLRTSTFDVTGSNCGLDWVEIIPGGRVEGCVTFEVPKTGGLQLMYAPFFYDQYGEGRKASFTIRR